MRFIGRLSSLGGVLCVSLVAALLSCALLAPLASAAETPNHTFRAVLVDGRPIPGNPLNPGDPGIENACGLAITPEGKVYMSDYYHRGVGLYRPGNPKAIPPEPVLPFKPAGAVAVTAKENGPCGLATDFFGNLYINNWHGAVTTNDGEIIDGGPSTGVATDPETADLYVVHRHFVSVYASPVDPGDAPVMKIGDEDSLGDAYGVAVSIFPATKGQVYVADAADNTVKVFDPAVKLDEPVREIDGAGTPQHGFNSLVDSSLAVDQSNGHLFVADNTQPGFTHPIAVIDEFNAEGLYRDQLARTIVDAEPVGLAVNNSAFMPEGETDGEVYVTTGNGSNVVFPGGIHTIPESEVTMLLAFLPSGAGETLAVTKSGTGTGTVSSESAGIFCGGSCKAEFNSGKTVKLTATPDPGSAFAGWSGPSCSGTGPCSVLMSAAATVGAEFVPAPALMGTGPSGSAPAADAAGPAAPAGVAAAGTALLKLGRPSPSSSATVALEATASEPGAVTATAPGLQPVKVRFSAPGSRTLRLHLNRAGRRALAKSKSGRLAFRVAIAFAPSGGARPILMRRTAAFLCTCRGK